MKQITKHVIKNSLKRIFLYRACLVRLKLMGVERVYSYTLAHETGVTSDQVRKDFSEFKITGNKRGGYKIDELLEKLESIFHRNQDHNIVLIGMGNLGLALSKYSRFVQRNMNIVATFDIDPFKQKQRSDLPVYSMSRLKEIIDRFKVRVAIIAVPEISAQEVADELVRLGIKGIVNFAPVLLKMPPDVVINNVNLCDELESVIYYVHKQIKADGTKNLELLYKGMKY
ncbi:MAG TPA: redox-sensing transcriptional repressor Rex [Bacteroidales bacterium]|nr:redox-sensing transcriptional repressor Rex [Bacteroidales bacterium]HOX75611.1 redox-sensing transcriptional repressor Rex [Bacteroidales bacterium]HQM68266.1 redox-sensing transcriptional repressor Rex [Bacteroidales bacterium]